MAKGLLEPGRVTKKLTLLDLATLRYMAAQIGRLRFPKVVAISQHDRQAAALRSAPVDLTATRPYRANLVLTQLL
jgi:hypothetical protein